jgi:hypothetical protein
MRQALAEGKGNLVQVQAALEHHFHHVRGRLRLSVAGLHDFIEPILMMVP